MVYAKICIRFCESIAFFIFQACEIICARQKSDLLNLLIEIFYI